MKDRIAEIIQKEGLTAQQFAKKIGVPPSSISHIFAGRNQPSRKFIYALLDNFKDINPEWLMFGTGEIYRHSEPAGDSSYIHTGDEAIHNELNNSINSNRFFTVEQPSIDIESTKYEPANIELNNTDKRSNESTSGIDILSSIAASEPEKMIDKIIVVYTDKTFDIYHSNL